MRWMKQVSILVVVIVALSIGTSAVFAQGPEQDRSRVAGGAIINAMAQLSGLTPHDILSSAQPGMTLEEVAAANGLDSSAVVAQAAADVTGRIEQAVTEGRMDQTQADDILSTLEADLVTAMSHPLPEPQDRPNRPPQGDQIRQMAEQTLIGALADATGMTPQDMLAQARENGYTTLAEVAEANGVNPDDVVAAAIASSTERINQALADGEIDQAQADQMLAGLEEFFNNAISHEINFDQRPGVDRAQEAGQQALIGALADATGMTPQDMLAQARENGYSTLAEVAEANGVNPDDVIATATANLTEHINQALADGNIDEDQAAQMLEGMAEFLNNAMYHEFDGRFTSPPQQQGGPGADIARTVVQEISTATGLSPEEILQAARDGSTLGDILTANGVDPSTIVDSVMGQVNAQLEEAVWNILNSDLPAPGPRQGGQPGGPGPRTNQPPAAGNAG